MDEWLKQILANFGVDWLIQPWFPKLMLAILLTMMMHYLSKKILQRFARIALCSSGEWDDILVSAAQRPIPILIWVLGISFATEMVRTPGQAEPFFAQMPMLREVGIVICLAWFLWRLISESSKHFVANRQARGETVDSTTVDALSKLGRLIIIIFAVLIIMQAFGFSLSGILAAGGIGGIAVGFAAKDLLANFFGGLTIYLDRPFSVGDWIRSPDKSIEGTVEVISWRHTRIRAFNKNPIYVPNSVFTTIVVENPSRMTHRRIRETVGIRYCDLPAMPAIVADIKAMLKAHSEIDANQTLIVNFNAFAASSLDIFIYTFTRTCNWVAYHEVKQDVLLKIAAIIESHQAEVAFPTQTLHIESESVAWPEDKH